MRRALVLIPLVGLLMGPTASAQARPNVAAGCDLSVQKATGANSAITATAYIHCSGQVARLYLHVCVFYGPNSQFSNARDIGCSPGYYHKGTSWYTWTCGPCDHLGPHHDTEFEEGRGYYFAWAEGLCPSCTPQYQAGPGKPCYYGGSTCT
jgi:hypothetical protein